MEPLFSHWLELRSNSHSSLHAPFPPPPCSALGWAPVLHQLLPYTQTAWSIHITSWGPLGTLENPSSLISLSYSHPPSASPVKNQMQSSKERATHSTSGYLHILVTLPEMPFHIFFSWLTQPDRGIGEAAPDTGPSLPGCVRCPAAGLPSLLSAPWS